MEKRYYKLFLWLFITIILFIFLIVSEVQGKNVFHIPDNDLVKLKNSIVVETHPFGPLTLARQILFEDDYVLIDPLESNPDYTLYHYDHLPKMFKVDSSGKISEIIVNLQTRQIVVGETHLYIPNEIKLN